jgi:hypothetical protein
MGLKLIKIGFVASTTVISFAAGVGTGAVVVAWAFAKMHEHDKEALDAVLHNLDEKFEAFGASDATVHDINKKSEGTKK